MFGKTRETGRIVLAAINFGGVLIGRVWAVNSETNRLKSLFFRASWRSLSVRPNERPAGLVPHRSVPENLEQLECRSISFRRQFSRR